MLHYPPPGVWYRSRTYSRRLGISWMKFLFVLKYTCRAKDPIKHAWRLDGSAPVVDVVGMFCLRSTGSRQRTT